MGCVHHPHPPHYYATSAHCTRHYASWHPSTRPYKRTTSHWHWTLHSASYGHEAACAQCTPPTAQQSTQTQALQTVKQSKHGQALNSSGIILRVSTCRPPKLKPLPLDNQRSSTSAAHSKSTTTDTRSCEQAAIHKAVSLKLPHPPRQCSPHSVQCQLPGSFHQGSGHSNCLNQAADSAEAEPRTAPAKSAAACSQLSPAANSLVQHTLCDSYLTLAAAGGLATFTNEARLSCCSPFARAMT